MNTEPVLIVEDDSDDREFIEEAWKELNYPNKLLFFGNGEDVFRYLDTEETIPFLILCDVNLPKMNGFQLKEKLLHGEHTRYKSIPLIFWSTVVSNEQTQRAYDLGGNGFFVKENSFKGLKESLMHIVDYWSKSKVPE